MSYFKDRPTRRQPDLGGPAFPFPGEEAFDKNYGSAGGIVGGDKPTIHLGERVLDTPQSYAVALRDNIPLERMDAAGIAQMFFSALYQSGKSPEAIERISDKIRRLAWAEERKHS